MKTLKEFIAENLEKPATTIQENTTEQVDENTTEKTVEENAEAEKGSIEDK
ncbi:hypothetical protein [Chryseobacterium nematophagum]|uniref:hypothetical protein n=1 Tax=Chryseobacterium nematophagum TaxID=2305228 RepID=UPI00160541DD|nr:hypothetical protein [Chryseobacterium nematophagum]